MADKIFTDATFKQEVLAQEKLVLVDFWAPWCGPCKIIGPIVEEIAKEYEGKTVVGKVNVDENPQTASQYNIMSIPTIALFKKGQVIKTVVGVQSKQALKQLIDENLS